MNKKLGALMLAFFWLALVASVVELYRHRNSFAYLAERIGLPYICLLLVVVIVMWALTVVAWQCMVAAWMPGSAPSFPAAARSLAYLLLGKYLPGGVWGFAGRHAATVVPDAHGRTFVAGVAEQLVNLLALAGIGGLAALAGISGNRVWLSALPLLPLLLYMSVHLFQITLEYGGRTSLLSRFRVEWVAPAWRPLLSACVLTVAQQAAFLVTVYMIARPLSHPGGSDALLVAGAYVLALAAGILAFFMPAGIVVREAVFVFFVGAAIPLEQAVFFATLMRAVTCAYDVSTAVLSWVANIMSSGE